MYTQSLAQNRCSATDVASELDAIEITAGTWDTGQGSSIASNRNQLWLSYRKEKKTWEVPKIHKKAGELGLEEV